MKTIPITSRSYEPLDIERFGGETGLDWLTYAGAQNMARAIHGYWRRRGFNVELRLEERPVRGARPQYFIRSDMVGGLPKEMVH